MSSAVGSADGDESTDGDHDDSGEEEKDNKKVEVNVNVNVNSRQDGTSYAYKPPQPNFTDAYAYVPPIPAGGNNSPGGNVLVDVAVTF